MNKSTLRKYAELIVRAGANVQKGQDVVINSSVDNDELVAMIAAECYRAGARKVFVNWHSLKVNRVTGRMASLEALSKIEDWEVERIRHYSEDLPAMIHILSDDPDGMKGVDQLKLAKASQASYPLIKPYLDKANNKYQWTIAGAASKGWARKVFPDLPTGKAVKKLWEAILFTSRADGDAMDNWKKHNAELLKHAEWLNSLRLDSLHYSSSNGTDFTVWLNPDALWLAGQEKTQGTKIPFNPNIPYEECFTSPMRGRAEGLVVATKPLSYQGELIEDFSLRFKDGKVVEIKAGKGKALLEHMIGMDEGASSLGECALVPFDSPINKSGVLFYNTLYDENAACHLALGKGFTNCIRDYESHSEEELHEMGINESMIHVDFMIGSRDLTIVGRDKDGRETLIFKDGNWAD